jgi:hypothetical protein
VVEVGAAAGRTRDYSRDLRISLASMSRVARREPQENP